MIPRPSHLHVATLPDLDPVKVSDRQRRVAHMAASVLLDYPRPERFAQYATVRDETAGLPGDVRERFAAFCALAEHWGEQELARHYVDTFDMKRKCSMYLSYFLTGDTRKRGMALVRFKEAYRADGFAIDRDELPDFLPVVLEFSAVGDADISAGLLGSHREGVEVLRAALTSIRSPYAQVVEAVCLTLPRISAGTKDRFLQLITAGPPSEMVGVDAMGPLEPFVPEPGLPDLTAARTSIPFDGANERP